MSVQSYPSGFFLEFQGVKEGVGCRFCLNSSPRSDYRTWLDGSTQITACNWCGSRVMQSIPSPFKSTDETKPTDETSAPLLYAIVNMKPKSIGLDFVEC